RGDQHAAAAEGHAHRRRVHARVEILQAQQADRADQRQQASGNQQHGRRNRGPQRQFRFRHGSITSPRNRNLASATLLTKPNSAISSAISKYTVDVERMPSMSRLSMPLI